MEYEILPSLEKNLVKIKKKDVKAFNNIFKKIIGIEHYKNLKKPLQHLKRVHINSHFVLTFEVNKKNNLIRFIDIDITTKFINKFSIYAII